MEHQSKRKHKQKNDRDAEKKGIFVQKKNVCMIFECADFQRILRDEFITFYVVNHVKTWDFLEHVHEWRNWTSIIVNIL